MTIIFRNRRLNATVRIALANAFYEQPENEDDWETWVTSRIGDFRHAVFQVCDGIELDGLSIDKTPHADDDLLLYDDDMQNTYVVELHWYGHETPKLTGGVAFADRVAEQEEELVSALAAIEYAAGVEATTIVLPIAVEE